MPHSGHGHAGRDRRRAHPRGPDPRQARGRAPRRGAAADHRGRGHGQDPRPDPPHRAPHLEQARPPRGDPGPHLHGEGRRRDGGARGPAHPLRLRGDLDRHLPRLRGPDPPRGRAGGGPEPRVPGADPPRAGHLPPGAVVAAASPALPAARRSHPPPRRAAGAREPRQGRGRLPGALPRVGGGSGCGRRTQRAARRRIHFGAERRGGVWGGPIWR